MTSTAKAQPNSVPPQFFVDSKKGELNELRTLLKGMMNQRDVKKRREVIKKVIAYMTLGIDVSKLFTDMVLISSTTDIVQKKMIYLYLVTYVESNPEQALMAINTFSKDCRRTNPNPQIRGLALRTLCSLRFPGAMEYIQGAITEGLGDPDPYVRKIAIIGLIKLHRSSKEQGIGDSFINTLYELIRDTDPIVSSNAITALNEILENEGGIAINRKMVVYLLNRIHQYNEFGQSTIFDIIARYSPQDDEEMLDILNILEDRLRHASSSVVLGCVKVFMNMTKDNPALLKQVFSRVQAPLITLFVGGEVADAYELSYCVLAHIRLIISRGAAEVFENDYKNFFCKYDEPTYIKFVKIDILKMIATENNLSDIVNELCAYVTDVNVEISKQSIRAIALIAMKIQSSSTAVIRQLIGFLSCGIDYVITETLVAMKDLLRKYRNLSEEIVPQLMNSMDVVSNDEGKSTLIWIVGEFGHEIDNGPYILEGIVDNFNPSENLQITYSLLTASVKLFLKRAPEMQNTLSTLFKLLFTDCDNPDIHDRAGFYYKLLLNSPEVADQIINCDKHPIHMFYEDNKSQAIEVLCQEFNQLSVIYQKPVKSLSKPTVQLQNNGESAAVNPSQIQREPEPTDLLSLDLLDQEIPSAPAYLMLHPDPSMDSIEFQNLWANTNDESLFGERLARAIGFEEVEYLFAQLKIICIAGGNENEHLKYYFYAREQNDGSPFLIELNIFMRTGEVQMTIKAENQRWKQDFIRIVYQALAPILNRS